MIASKPTLRGVRAVLFLGLALPAVAEPLPAALPELLVAADGTPVTTAAQWAQQRRPEILELFRTHVYGRAPAVRPDQMNFETIEHAGAAFDGAARRTRIEIVYSGPGGTGRIPVRLYSPPAGIRIKGCFLLIVNRGREIIEQAETAPSPYWPVRAIVARGYATVAFANGDVAADDKDQCFDSGVFRVLGSSGQTRAADDGGAVAAWAWGASRVIDYLAGDLELRGAPVAVVGHSRGGKTALWCGALDDRVALSISNDSGSTGAALARTKRGETIAMINRAFPHWFAANYKRYDNRESALPVDQHMLVAAIAPRLVYVAAAADNLRADPLAQFQACVEAGPVFRLFGLPDLGASEMPGPDVPVHAGAIGYHAHRGGHNLTEFDWRMFMDFADRYLPVVRMEPRRATMEHAIIDENAPAHLWGKCAADLNGDGRPDLLVGGWMGGGLVWYENPTWQKRVIDGTAKISTDIEVADVDRDGRPDVIAIVGKEGPVWYRNPDWTPHPITLGLALHDIEVADFDGDGDVDIIGRNQNWSEKTSGATLFMLRQETPDRWTRATQPIPNGEGLKAADIDGDGDLDVIVNGVWLENPRDLLAPWPRHVFGPEWKHDATFVAVGDVNGDGRPDIVLAPSEKAGTRYRISWFEAPADPRRGAWIEHVLEPDVETVHHFIGVADFNRDGFADIATAAMVHGQPPTNVTLYLNHGQGRAWTRQIIGINGSHSMRIVDLDGTGAPSLFGANYRTTRVELWRNVTK